MTARRPIVLVTGTPSTLRRLINGDSMIAEEFADRNGVTWLKTTAVASAVRNLRIDAAAAGTDPSIYSEGTGADIGLRLVPKGAGRAYINYDEILSKDTAAVPTNKDLRDPTNLVAFDPSIGCTMQLVKIASGTGYTKVGIVNDPTYDGSQASADGTLRPLLGHTSGASTNDKAGLITSGLGCRPAWLPEVSFPVRFGANIANVWTWFGFGGSDLAQASIHPGSVRCAAFLWADPDFGSIQAVVGDGSSETFVDTGYTPVADEHLVLRVRCSPTDYFFWINGTLVAQIDTTVPNSLLENHVQVRVQTQENVAKVVRCGSIPIWRT